MIRDYAPQLFGFKLAMNAVNHFPTGVNEYCVRKSPLPLGIDDIEEVISAVGIQQIVLSRTVLFIEDLQRILAGIHLIGDNVDYLAKMLTVAQKRHSVIAGNRNIALFLPGRASDELERPAARRISLR